MARPHPDIKKALKFYRLKESINPQTNKPYTFRELEEKTGYPTKSIHRWVHYVKSGKVELK